MYDYSPVKSIYIKNFRNIGEVKIDFDETPIIALIGENEAGKTSVCKAFAVCALHAHAREQKDYIRDGTNGFGVAIELQDNSLITRIKTQTLNQYQVKFSNGEVWSTNKIDAGLPVQVQELMGLIEEPETKEFLQIRTYEDQLLFVVSPASTNYKVMYDALKVDQVTRAIKKGSIESNELRAKINTNEVSMTALANSLKGLRIYELEPLVNVKNRLVKQMADLEKLERANDIANRIRGYKKELGALDLIEEHKLADIDLVEVNKLISAYRLLNNNADLISKLNLSEKAMTAEEIDLTNLNRLGDILNRKRVLQGQTSSAANLVKLAELNDISENEVRQLDRAVDLINKIKEDNKTLKIIDIQCEEINENEIRQLEKAIELKNIIKNDTDMLNRTDVGKCRLIEQSDFNAVYKISNLIALKKRNEMLVASAIQSENYVSQVENYLKHCGAKVVTCTKCGEQIVLDLDDLEHVH